MQTWFDEREKNVPDEYRRDYARAIAQGLPWCHTCCNARFVRSGAGLNDTGFGRLIPCPVCNADTSKEGSA